MTEHMCDICRRGFDSEKRFNMHKGQFHRKSQVESNQRPCPFCDRAFDTRRSLNIHVGKTHERSAANLNDGKTYIERYKRVLSEVPDEYNDALNEITGSGKSLWGFQAAVCYLESALTQKEVGEIFGVSTVTVRNIAREIIDMGVVSVSDVETRGDWQKFGEDRAGNSEWNQEHAQ